MAYDPTYPGQDVATLTALSLEKIKKELIDSASEDYATYYLLTSNGRVDYEDGGTVITEPLMYDLNKTISSYVAGQAYNTERPSGFTRLYYKWAYVGGTIVIDGPTEFENSGSNGIVSMTKAFIQQLKISFADAMNTMFLGDGTGNAGADLMGLNTLIEVGGSNPSDWSTVGNVNSGTNEWWRNYWLDASSTVWGTGAAAYGITQLKNARRQCIKPGMGAPDVFLTGLAQYGLLEHALESNIVYNMPALADKKYADVGFGGIRIDQTPVVYDIAMDTAMAQTWLLINTKALRLVIGKNKAFDVSPPVEHPWMDAKIMKAKMYGQLTCLGRRDCLGRLKLNAASA